MEGITIKSDKIGIITFHCSYNYGSVLQAFALQSFLKSNDYNASIIDYEESDNFENYKIFRWKTYRTKPILFVADILYLFPNLKRKKSFDTFKRNYFNLSKDKYFRNSYLSTLNKKYDTFICGSDQIWNMDCTHGMVPAYFLEFVSDENKKIAYAPSLAHSDFKEEYLDKKRLKNALKTFSSISLRERSTVEFLREYTEKNVECVLDPVLLLNREVYYDMSYELHKSRKYILLYMLEKKDNRLIQYCNELQKRFGYSVIYISKMRYLKLHKGKKVFGCSPQEFLSLIRNAEYIVTNSFHATAFSVIFRKKFHTFTTPRSFARMNDFLSDIGLKNRIYEKGCNITEFIDYNNVQHRLDTLCEHSKNFLLDALEE